MFLLPAWAAGDRHAVSTLVPIFLLTLLGVAPIALWVLLVGYVFGDARRRAMNAVLWTLLAIFIPSGIGIILYFILRDPIPAVCPGCGALAAEGPCLLRELRRGGAARVRAVPPARRGFVAELPELRGLADGRGSAGGERVIRRRPGPRSLASDDAAALHHERHLL